MTGAPPLVRIDKLLANLGYGSRREVQTLVRAGRVLLDGLRLASADERIAPSVDLETRLWVSGEPLDPVPGAVLMLNKPCGVTCSHNETGPLVYGLLPPRWRLRQPPLSSVGRLDKDTSGLLLLTDDGALLHRIIAPKTHLPKRYRVGLARPLRGDESTVFASGTLMLDGEAKPLRPAVIEIESPTEVAITITEGRYHQVRRMFAALGNHVIALHRDRIGGLTLPDDLASGDRLRLYDNDVARIFDLNKDATTVVDV